MDGKDEGSWIVGEGAVMEGPAVVPGVDEVMYGRISRGRWKVVSSGAVEVGSPQVVDGGGSTVKRNGGFGDD